MNEKKQTICSCGIKRGKQLLHFKEYKKESAWAKKYGKRYTDVKELIKDALIENGVLCQA
jgi:hypothetical protein